MTVVFWRSATEEISQVKVGRATTVSIAKAVSVNCQISDLKPWDLGPGARLGERKAGNNKKQGRVKTRALCESEVAGRSGVDRQLKPSAPTWSVGARRTNMGPHCTCRYVPQCTLCHSTYIPTYVVGSTWVTSTHPAASKPRTPPVTAALLQQGRAHNKAALDDCPANRCSSTPPTSFQRFPHFARALASITFQPCWTSPATQPLPATYRLHFQFPILQYLALAPSFELREERHQNK